MSTLAAAVGLDEYGLRKSVDDVVYLGEPPGEDVLQLLRLLEDAWDAQEAEHADEVDDLQDQVDTSNEDCGKAEDRAAALQKRLEAAEEALGAVRDYLTKRKGRPKRDDVLEAVRVVLDAGSASDG